MILAVVSALGVAVVGAVFVRSAPRPARWLSVWLCVAFALAVVLVDRSELRPVVRRSHEVDLAADLTTTRGALLRAAAAAGPGSAELVVHWRATAIELRPVADDLRALGAVAVSPAALPFAPEDVQVRATTGLSTDRPIAFEVRVDGAADARLPGLVGELSVASAAGPLHRQPLAFVDGTADVTLPPTAAGDYRLEVRLAVGAHRIEVGGGFTLVEPAEVLVVDADVVAAALRVQGERVREVVAWPADWQRHDRIVLGRSLPGDDQRQLVEHVRDGAGLFVLASAFGGDGEPLRELLPVLPLPPPPPAEPGAGGSGVASVDGPDAEATERNEPPPADPEQPSQPPPEVGTTKSAGEISSEPVEVDKHAIAMVLVVDRSGTMGTRLPNGLTKMSYAKTSALRTAQSLGEGDQVAIVTFGNRHSPQTALPLTDASDAATVTAAVEQLRAFQESTWLLGGLRRAHELLRATTAAVKHVVVISDGEFYDEQLVLGREAYQMRSDSRISVSIVSIIDDLTDPGFKDKAAAVARDGGGGFVATSSADTVPRIVSTEVRRVLSRVGRKPRTTGDAKPEPQAEPERTPPPPKTEPEPQPEPPPPAERDPPARQRLPVYAVAESGLLAPQPERWPSLGEAVASEAPLESRVLLVAGDEGWPLLAYANRGLGRVGVFTGGLAGGGGQEFREAAAFPAWIAQWLQATSVAATIVEAPPLQRQGSVQPPAPLPRDRRWLTGVAGAAPTTEPLPEPRAPGDARAVTQQVADVAPWLLLGVILLAIGERILAVRAMRQGER